MKQFLFVDTNYLCAFYNESDSLHKKAKDFSLSLQKFHVIISNFILLESYTILSQRVSKNHALIFKKDMYSKKYYSIYWITKALEEQVWNTFISIKNKNFSYVDASIIAVMQKEKIKHLLSFDKSFEKLQKQFGFTLVK